MVVLCLVTKCQLRGAQCKCARFDNGMGLDEAIQAWVESRDQWHFVHGPAPVPRISHRVVPRDLRIEEWLHGWDDSISGMSNHCCHVGIHCDS